MELCLRCIDGLAPGTVARTGVATGGTQHSLQESDVIRKQCRAHGLVSSTAAHYHSNGRRPSGLFVPSAAVVSSRSKLWMLTPSNLIGLCPASVFSSSLIALATMSSASLV